MLKESIPGVYQSDIFDSQKRIIHGFSTRNLGDMRDVPPRHALKKLLGVSSYRLVGASQEHGSSVHVVTPADYGLVVANVDGLVFRQKPGDTRVALGVITADCVPLLFADTDAGVIAAAHAGRKGTRDHITGNIIRSMVEVGARPDRIRVAFGPYIGPCCYEVQEDVMTEFRKRFTNPAVAISNGSKWYLDLGQANMETLLDAGVRQDHIGHHLVCTADHVDRFYSYRREQKDTYGEQMAMIALSV